MNRESLKALRGSIKKWEAVAAGKGYEAARSNCNLCKAHPDCEGCPVALKVNTDCCSRTPYIAWWKHQSRVHGPISFDPEERRRIHPGCKECVRLAKAEVSFLKSLLPKKPRRKKAAAKRKGTSA